MTRAFDRNDTTPSAKQAALAFIEKLPRDAYLDEIIDALWEWSMSEPGGADACSSAASRLMAINPAELVMAHRAARHADILGTSRQTALDAVHALLEHASLDDILVAVATWRLPDDVD